MSELTSTPKDFSSGDYQVDMFMVVGTAKIQQTTADFTDKDIPNTDKTSADKFTIKLVNCSLKAITTGDAEVFITPLFNNNHIRTK